MPSSCPQPLLATSQSSDPMRTSIHPTSLILVLLAAGASLVGSSCALHSTGRLRTRPSATELVRACVESESPQNPAEFSNAPCMAIGEYLTTAELANLAQSKVVSERVAVAFAIATNSSRRDFSSVFASAQIDPAVWSIALGRLDGEIPAFGLTARVAFMLCRHGCKEFRLALEQRLARFSRADWMRACVAAAALGFIGDPESESVLLAALVQRRSWLLSCVAARALGRLAQLTPEGRAILCGQASAHWSLSVRETSREACETQALGEGFQRVSQLREAALKGFAYVSMSDMEPVLAPTWPPSRVSTGIGLAAETPLGCLKPTVHGVPTVAWGAHSYELGRLHRLGENHVSEAKLEACIPAVGDAGACSWGISPSVGQERQHAFGIPVSVVRSTRSGEARSWIPVAEIPGRPQAGVALDDGTVLLVTDDVAVVLDAGGVAGSICSR